MKLYKVTRLDGSTGASIRLFWGPGITHSIPEQRRRPKLCTGGVIHAYSSIEQAVFMNPGHMSLGRFLLWEAEGDVVTADATKVGVYQLTTLHQVEAPQPTTKQRARFAILCALRVYSEPSFVEWARRWLSGEDVSASAAAQVGWSASARRSAWAVEAAIRSPARTPLASAQAAGHAARASNEGLLDIAAIAREAMAAKH